MEEGAYLSVVIPVYNEEESLQKLHQLICEALNSYPRQYEVVYVDDGSNDSSQEILAGICGKDNHARLLKLRRHFGKSAALEAGFSKATGELIAQIDADLQNDPKDLPKLLKKLEAGNDSVIGWRRIRDDPFEKRFFSKIANRIRRTLIHDPVHDSVCGIAVHKRECVRGIRLDSDMHRYLPSIIHMRGYTVSDCVVSHQRRPHGKSKYGMGRLLHGFVDVLRLRLTGVERYIGQPRTDFYLSSELP